MYTYEKAYDGRITIWSILDPDGVFICNVDDEDQAQALLTHLNR